MEYQFSFNRRLLSKIFVKFPNTFIAFCELINNSIQADAKRVNINIDENDDQVVSKTKFNEIIILDDGNGVAKSEFRKKILEIATDVKSDGQGIGRFAALQLGSKMIIETVGYEQDENCFYKSIVELSISELEKFSTLDKVVIPVQHEKLGEKENTYYKVTISDFYDESITNIEKHKKASKDLLIKNIKDAVFVRYADIIFNKKVKFTINDEVIDHNEYVIGEIEHDNRDFVDLNGTKHKFNYSYVHLKSTGNNQKIFIRTKNNEIKTIAYSFNHRIEIPDPNIWFVYLDSTYFDQHVDIFRNFQIAELDEGANHVLGEIKVNVEDFFAEKYKKYKNFLDQLKNDQSYPYISSLPSSESKQIMFNQLAYYLENKYHLLSKREKLRELIYPLIDKTLNYGDLEDILSKIIKLDPQIIRRFKSLLHKADLEDVIFFSENVANKTQFLNFLHEIVYGKPSKHLKERGQLHKILEKHLWIFGEQYSQTPQLFSDKNLQNTLNELREKFFIYDPSDEDENLIELENQDLKNITDLFFYNEKILDNEEREIMIVELKAPKVKLSQKELTQVDKYMYQIENQGVFTSNLKYKLILIGSDISGFAKSRIGQIDLKRPSLYSKSKSKNIESYVFTWSYLIQENRKKLSYLGNMLRTKDKDVKDIFASEFSDIDIENLATTIEQ